MRCPACAADNTPTSKFCGVCGVRLAPGPPTVPPADGPSVPQAPVLGDGARAGGSLAGSLAGSLRLPEARGARLTKLGLVLALDAALVVGGVVLATRRPATTAPRPADAGVASGVGSGAPVPVPDRDPTGGVVGPGRTGQVPGPGRDPAVSNSGQGTPNAGTPGAVRPGPTVDGGRPLDATPLDAGDAPPVDAAGPVDAMATEPAIDGAAEPVVDAAGGPEIDAAAPDLDAGPEAAVGADAIMRQVNRQLVASSGRLDRCYSNATKSLPPDEALRGQVDIGLAVLLTGAVDGVSVLRNTTGSDQLGQCAQAVVAGWTFSPHDGAEPIHLVRSFTFGPK